MTIFRKINTEETFFPFTIITNKDYFPRKKNDYKLNFRKFTSRFIYGRDVISANCVEQRRPENGKNEMFLLLQLLLLQPNATQ